MNNSDNRHKPLVDWGNVFHSLTSFIQWRRPSPDIEPSDDLLLILKKLRPPIVILIMILTTGTIGFMAIDDYKPLDALYMTVITIATVGFGEIGTASSEGRLFTICLIFLGIGAFGYSTGLFISIVSDGTILRVIGERIMLKNIAFLENHFIICGINETAREVVRQFSKKKIPYVIIDETADLDKRKNELNIQYYIKGQPFKDDSLRKAHISTARGVITTSQNDNDNFAVVVSVKILLEKYSNTKASIISLARNEENKEKLYKIGASHVITPYIIAGQRALSYAVKPEASYFIDDIVYNTEIDLDIEELLVDDSFSHLMGKPLLDTDLKDHSIKVIAIKRGKKIDTEIAGDKVINKNDTLIVIGKVQNFRGYLKKYKP